MLDFYLEYWPEILLSLVTAASIAFSKYLFKQLKNYNKLLENQDQSEITALIRKEIEPVCCKLEQLNGQIELINITRQEQINAIIESYKFRLIQLCRRYLDQGYITTAQFDQLSEFHKLYHKLGGNSQGDEYYEKAKRLKIKDDEINKNTFEE